MKKSFVVALLLAIAGNLNAQSKSGKSFSSKFKISLSQGLSYNFDKKIFRSDTTIGTSASKFTVEMTSFELGFFISRYHEIGLSIGKNTFTTPSDYVSVIVFEDKDTTKFSFTGNKYIDLTWFAVYYNFHFLNSYKAGIKIGDLKPMTLYDEKNIYLYLSVGKFYKVTENFLIDLTFGYSNRSRNFKSFESNQLNLSLGFNLRL
jgi:hypothetical protein